MAFCCGLVAIILITPVFVVLGYGVTINTALESHVNLLVRKQFDLSAQAKAYPAGSKRRDSIVLARDMVHHLITVIKLSDVRVHVCLCACGIRACCCVEASTHTCTPALLPDSSAWTGHHMGQGGSHLFHHSCSRGILPRQGCEQCHQAK